MKRHTRATADVVALDWTTAQTLADLGELTARWLTGDIPDVPGYHGPPAPETAPLAATLAALNRAGLVTYGSQPGVIDQYGSQRAFVDGLCTPATFGAIEAACLRAGLIVLACGPNSRTHRDDCYIPVTVDQHWQPFTNVGSWPSSADVRRWLSGLNVPKSAIRAAAHAWQVCIFDPEWGRDWLLWTTLTDAIVPTAPTD